jgi:hypothetical protein
MWSDPVVNHLTRSFTASGNGFSRSGNSGSTSPQQSQCGCEYGKSPRTTSLSILLPVFAKTKQSMFARLLTVANRCLMYTSRCCRVEYRTEYAVHSSPNGNIRSAAHLSVLIEPKLFFSQKESPMTMASRMFLGWIPRKKIACLILRDETSAASSPENTTGGFQEPSRKPASGFESSAPMISVMLVFVIVLGQVSSEIKVWLLIIYSFCFWLRKCIDDRAFEATRANASQEDNARLQRLENAAKAQSFEEWRRSQETSVDALATESQQIIW